MKRMSIRWRLTLWYAGAFALLLTTLCVALLLLTQHQLLARTDDGLREELQELALEVRLARDADDMARQLHARFFQHDIYDFLVTDSQGTILFASSGLSPEQAAKFTVPSSSADIAYATDRTLDGRPVRLARSAVGAPESALTVQALTSLAPIKSDMLTLQLLMAGLLPAGVALALAGGYFLATRALAPVEQIVQVANSITIENLHERIDVGNSDDELGHLAQTLNSLIDRLERAVDEIRRFTADASHEIRTPLAALRTEAECALRMRRQPEEYERALANVVDEASRLGNLADQLLCLSRHDAGISDLQRDPVRVDLLVRDVADQLRSLAQDKQLALELVTAEECEVVGDDIRLSQAFFNVLENAIKYTPADGTIRVSCRSERSLIKIEVADSGIGIAAEHLPHVFERFYRVDSSRNAAGGTGLGLSIARATLIAHQGNITLRSTLGVGTTAVIEIPKQCTTSNASVRRDAKVLRAEAEPCEPAVSVSDKTENSFFD